MAFDVKLPDIGEGVAEGEIVRWFVKAGDAVREDQPLVEVMTDKATVEIPSPRNGVIAAVHVAEGKVVPVGTVIVSIEVGAIAGATPADETGATFAGTHHETPSGRGAPAATAESYSGRTPNYGSLAPSGQVHSTPAVRTLARQLGVALAGLRGSGPNGRIVAEDVKSASGPASAAQPGAVAERPRAASDGPLAAAAGDERLPIRGMRRRIAEHMKHSLERAAQFTFVAECDMSAIVAHRSATLAHAGQQGVTLTFLAYLVKALDEPIRKFPLLNASVDESSQEIVVRKSLHVGMATATEQGLMVPVIRDVDRRTLLQVAGEIQRLARGARDGVLKLEEMQGGTLTVTSTGARGGLLATPILHHPQVAILGMHEVKKKPVVVEDAIVIREMTNLSLSLDHRVVDGALGADFLYALIARLEKPASWLTPEVIG
ncbi:MAG: 2-oxo acid dehydrogenase subunit E2 [Candidatus Eisenbacteria bacterium]|uniref:Dihydrolipoamide acetyltransferase component of pyruvate dehydrogenase complex n=1 Tax=Eiseniibacteriota bacterium TaxID=2212470 RepID=A0A849SGD3_UNCEI|nr:2-oxo acid dehydrogenase subunit E2 [Candidatus Eisenbacteria bacterium]